MGEAARKKEKKEGQTRGTEITLKRDSTRRQSNRRKSPVRQEKQRNEKKIGEALGSAGRTGLRSDPREPKIERKKEEKGKNKNKIKS